MMVRSTRDLDLRNLGILWATGLLALVAAGSCSPPPSPPPRLEATQILSGRDADPGFARALTPRNWSFPADHGSHPDFQTEWWYFTGHLASAEGEAFGFQWTLFRRALTPPAQRTPRASAWAADQLYLGHFALTKVGPRPQFFAFERVQRGALGLAQVESSPFRLVLEDWQAHSLGEGFLPLRLFAREQGIEIDLELGTGTKPVVLQGDQGLSRKGPAPGQASYYYSLTRLPAQGRVVVDGRNFTTRGEAWLDREWSTSSLSPDQAGWDWFSLQLADGRELMIYQMRRRDGSADTFSSATWIAADGTTTQLAAEAFRLEPRGAWISPRTGTRYPAAWRIFIPSQDLELDVTPLVADQELDVAFRYWEGAVDVAGRQGGQTLRGRGYLEMVGYAERGADAEPVTDR